jgi:hypothetical protein
MDKIAQRLNWLQRTKEKTFGKLKDLKTDFLGSDEYREIIDKLISVDDEVREKAFELKDYLKIAESNFNRREYMFAISYLAKFHEKMEEIMTAFQGLNDVVHKHHHAFLFGDLDPNQKEYLMEKMPKWFKGAPTKTASVKEAGLSDWWYSMTTDRGKGLRQWEKRFPQTARELKNQTNNMLNKSKALSSTFLNLLKQLGKYRVGRKIEDYVRLLPGINNKYRAYNKSFNDFYNKYVKSYIESQKAAEEAKSKALGVGGVLPGAPASTVGGPSSPSSGKPSSTPTKPYPGLPISKPIPAPVSPEESAKIESLKEYIQNNPPAKPESSKEVKPPFKPPFNPSAKTETSKPIIAQLIAKVILKG